jgi:hypothetical protein
MKPFDILDLSKKLVVACYTLTNTLPLEEKTNLTFYIRNEALKVHFTAVKTVFKKKKRRKRRLIKTAKNALVIIDAAVEVLVEVKLVKEADTAEVMQLSSTCYQQLDRWKKGK